MKTVDVTAGSRAYKVMIGSGLIGQSTLWSSLLAGRRAHIVTNERVAPLYLVAVQEAIGPASAAVSVLPDGEQHKTIETWQRLVTALAADHAGRDSCLVALGGGVIGDLCGFAAATYMRGVSFIQVPTTLLAQVDAAVGGKTGVNLNAGKNLVGAFHQPDAVLADIGTLATLAEREYVAGLAEVVKYGAIRDTRFLGFLEQNVQGLLARDPETVSTAVESSVRHKAEIVAQDERESGIRAILNYGHSFAHAMETLTDYRQFLHGEAVAIGMVVAATLSEQRGLCPAGVRERLAALLQQLGLPVSVPKSLETNRLLGAMQLDKKNTASQRRLVLLTDAGTAMVDSGSSDEDVRSAISACRAN